VQQRLGARRGRLAAVNVTVAYSTLIGVDDQPAHLQGYGPITAEVARRIAADGCDLDHATPWERGGTTSASNLGPVHRGHHNDKTHHGWRPISPNPADTSGPHSPAISTTSTRRSSDSWPNPHRAKTHTPSRHRPTPTHHHSERRNQRAQRPGAQRPGA
jgi:hypothetical protein